MGILRRITFRWVDRNRFKACLILVFGLIIVRWSKGALFVETYSFLSRPFWPGTAQKEWVQDGKILEQELKITLLNQDNNRLREMLSLKNLSDSNRISAAVISRKPNGWWQQLEINKGSNNQIKIGDAVLGPGGLFGIIYSVRPDSSRVRLLTDPGSRIGVWVQRIKRHGMLQGMGTNRTKLTFLDKDSKAQIGDFVSTSPASTLLPPNVPIGVIKFLDNDALPAPYGIIQLIASPEAIDWVQVIRN